MGLRYFPGNVRLGNYSIKGALRTDASAYITGKLEAATGIAGDASMDLALHFDTATGMDVCGPVTCATALTVCGSAQ